jgi:hypothetical protein
LSNLWIIHKKKKIRTSSISLTKLPVASILKRINSTGSRIERGKNDQTTVKKILGSSTRVLIKNEAAFMTKLNNITLITNKIKIMTKHATGFQAK